MTVSDQANRSSSATPPVMDYEGSQYETDFWVGQGRAYEDAAERIALRKLIPARGKRIAEIGAAFGRLVELYQGYEQIILLDYSRSQLQTAAQRLGHDPRYLFVAGNIYNLPLADGVLDTLVMVRVMHHLAEVPNALSELARVMHKSSTAVVEYANKRNLKALLRWWFGRQPWSPHSLEPIEFVKLNFDFHPVWMNRQFHQAGFVPQQQLAVSHLRLGALKRLFSPGRLAMLDASIFEIGGKYPVAPSIFVRMATTKESAPTKISTDAASIAALLRCTKCGAQKLVQTQEELLSCSICGAHYSKKAGVWDFKEGVE